MAISGVMIEQNHEIEYHDGKACKGLILIQSFLLTVLLGPAFVVVPRACLVFPWFAEVLIRRTSWHDFGNWLF